MLHYKLKNLVNENTKIPGNELKRSKDMQLSKHFSKPYTKRRGNETKKRFHVTSFKSITITPTNQFTFPLPKLKNIHIAHANNIQSYNFFILNIFHILQTKMMHKKNNKIFENISVCTYDLRVGSNRNSLEIYNLNKGRRKCESWE